MNNPWMQPSVVRRMFRDAMPPVATSSVAAWVAENVRFNESSYRGPFELAGREYVCEALEDFNRSDVSDEVLVFGSQSGKTATIMAGVAWRIVNSPVGIFWAMANITQAKRVSKQRFKPMLRATKATSAKIPSGKDRHDFATLEMSVGASSITMTGSNSAANLAGVPAGLAILDEVDKFDQGGKREADAVNLAEQRTKDQPSPQRWKTSTPTTPEGLIWREYLKGDQRRYFVPCPACGKDVVFAWSKQFTVLPIQGCEAFIRWPSDARHADGTWNLDEVKRTTYAECPHCGVHILDHEKGEMVRKGKWKPTANAAASGFVSRHLSSLYATSPETTWGRLAVKFLQNKDTLEGLQGFINGDLAEPYMSQDIHRERHELIAARAEVGDEWRPLLTVDCQAKSPSFWYAVRLWNEGNSRGIEAGSADTWEEIEAMQRKHKIDSCGVFIDSGFGARSDAEVYQVCARHCDEIPSRGQVNLVGWMPVKGQPGRKRWTHPVSKLSVPWFTKSVDPYAGTNMGGLASLELLEFATDAMKDVLDALRRQQGGFRWEVSESMASDEYWRHMDAEVKTAVRNKFSGLTKWSWIPRSKHWPNHIFDCEVMQLVAASYLGLFSYEQKV